MILIFQKQRYNIMIFIIKLVLNDVVEDFQKEEDQMMIGGVGIQELRCVESLKK